MRLLFVCPDMRTGGAERHWATLIPALARRDADARVLCLAEEGGLLPMRHHQRLLTRLVAPRVDRVIAVTSRQIGPLARLGYRRERIEVIANGVFDSVRLEPEKGVGVFIRAVDAARRSRPAIRGLVAGEGPERPRLERLAAGSGVELLGVRDDVADLMAAADAVALTSEAEALPMSVLEAMAAARPVIVTDVGGMAEAVVPGETGLLVPAGDAEAAARALVELASDRERAGRMGEAGRARQRERFDGETMVARYERTLA